MGRGDGIQVFGRTGWVLKAWVPLYDLNVMSSCSYFSLGHLPAASPTTSAVSSSFFSSVSFASPSTSFYENKGKNIVNRKFTRQIRVNLCVKTVDLAGGQLGGGGQG